MARRKPITTLAIDIGGSGIKAMLLDESGHAISDRVRSETPIPATPAAIFAVITGFVKVLGEFDRVSVGFPGVVKAGVTWTAHNLNPAWVGFNLRKTVERRLKKPARVANDAAVQGYGAIRGNGVELMLTLGTGLGSSLFTDGHLVPGLEVAHHPWHKGKTYEDLLGRRGLKASGRKRWNHNVELAIVQLEALFNFDHLYIGGGNSTKIDFKLPRNTTQVSNQDGLLGGVALWRNNEPGSSY